MPPPRPGREAAPLTTPLPGPGGGEVTVVHLTAEYVPFARTGGLAEAVNGLARFQGRRGVATATILPLHRSARDKAGALVPVGDPMTVTLHPGRHETVRLFRQRTPDPEAPVYFVEHDGFFDRTGLYGEGGRDYEDNPERWAVFCLAALEALPRISDGHILLHAHDWHCALALAYLRTRHGGHPWYQGIRTVLSVHNAGYQGHLPPAYVDRLGLPRGLFDWRVLEWYGKLNLLKAGLVFADAAVTVSPNHAVELRTPAGGFGLQDVFGWMGPRFTGILNGIDQRDWDPSTDQEIVARYSARDLSAKAACKAEVQRVFGLEPRPDAPLFGMAARLVTQKGLDLIVEGGDLFRLDAQFIFLGQGERRYVEALRRLGAAHPGQVAVETGFTDALEHQLMAGADLLLMPCQYEPCGLTQMRAQRYGTLPLVRRVGGLADTVDQGVTGFIFDPFESEPLVGAALRALDLYARPEEWHRMRVAAMGRDFSWERSVEEYLALYQQVLDGGYRARPTL